MNFKSVGQWLLDLDGIVLGFIMTMLRELKTHFKKILKYLQESPVPGWVFHCQQYEMFSGKTDNGLALDAFPGTTPPGRLSSATGLCTNN